MGKISDFAYNIGTSLNQEDINTHRQAITPTAQTLQSLSTDEQLVITQDNQALLNANEVQRAWEVESGDRVWDYDGDWRGKSNAQLAKETREFMSDKEALIIKDLIGSVVMPIGFADAYHNAKTDEEKALAVATAFKIHIGKARTYVQKAKTQPKQSATTQTKATCSNGTVCFTAGTLIETSEGLKAIETFTGGELIWSRNDSTLEYGYHPVIATKATPDQPIFQVTVKNNQGDIETLETTAEHPFWIKETGWLKASLLEQGMILLDRNNQEVEVLSQYLIPNHTDTVYNIEVDNFHTYHVGRLGVWVHNADCCDFGRRYGNATEILTKGGWVDAKTGKVMYLDPFTNTGYFQNQVENSQKHK